LIRALTVVLGTLDVGAALVFVFDALTVGVVFVFNVFEVGFAFVLEVDGLGVCAAFVFGVLDFDVGTTFALDIFGFGVGVTFVFDVLSFGVGTAFVFVVFGFGVAFVLGVTGFDVFFGLLASLASASGRSRAKSDVLENVSGAKGLCVQELTEVQGLC
jgi:hypothetical protein